MRKGRVCHCVLAALAHVQGVQPGQQRKVRVSHAAIAGDVRGHGTREAGTPGRDRAGDARVCVSPPTLCDALPCVLADQAQSTCLRGREEAPQSCHAGLEKEGEVESENWCLHC